MPELLERQIKLSEAGNDLWFVVARNAMVLHITHCYLLDVSDTRNISLHTFLST